ncbi:MAG TPA: polysaccharide biosynthesis tyrosine autokinase [Gemmatimonadaceae bacterium]|nr:polysaccharide biosynthesis tyrosine autokinase [Gemmatimonadaceae bacterium]
MATSVSLAIPDSPQPEERDITLREIWLFLRRNLWLVLACALVCMAGGVAYVMRATPVYQSSVSVRVDERQSGVPGLEALSGISSGSELGTEMEVLKSRTIAEDVVEQLGLRVRTSEPERVERGVVLVSVDAPRGDTVAGEFVVRREDGGQLRLEDTKRKEVFIPVTPGKPTKLGGITLVFTEQVKDHLPLRLTVTGFDQAVRRLLGNVTVVRPNRDANIVRVQYRGVDLGLTRDVPNAMARRFMDSRREVQKTEARSTVAFLRTQLDTLASQLSVAEDRLRTFREANQVVSLATEASEQVSRMAELQAQRGQVESERSALAALMGEIQHAAAGRGADEPSPYRRLVAFPTMVSQTATTDLLRSITVTEDQRAQLLVRRTPADPDVQALTERVHELETQLQAVAQTYLQGLATQVTSLDRTLAQFGERLERVPAKEVTFARLARQPQVLDGIVTMLQQRLQEARIAEAVEDPSVRIVDPAIIPDRPVAPNKPLLLALAGLGGLMIGFLLAFVRENMDHTVRSREHLMELSNAPVLGLIPRIQEAAIQAGGRFSALGRIRDRNRALSAGTQVAVVAAGNATPVRAVRGVAGQPLPMAALAERLVTHSDPRSPVSEAYRALRTNISFADPDKVATTLVFTSALPGDGKSTSVANLAVTLAQQGLRVIAVDADMRRGTLNALFGIPRLPGLSNALVARGTPVDEAIVHVRVGEDAVLDVLPTGPFPPNPSELLDSDRARTLFDDLGARYDVVLIDTAPLNLVTDAAVLGARAGGVVLVVRANHTPAAAVRFAVDRLARVRAPLMGTLLNDIDVSKQHGNDVAYGYYYDYRSDEQKEA